MSHIVVFKVRIEALPVSMNAALRRGLLAVTQLRNRKSVPRPSPSPVRGVHPYTLQDCAKTFQSTFPSVTVHQKIAQSGL